MSKGPRAMSRTAVAWSVVVSMVASTAHAAQILSPRSGDTVGAFPTFTFDFAEGRAEVEYATTPEIKASDGSFVDPTSSDFFLVRNGRASQSNRLLAGQRYWHIRMGSDVEEDAGAPYLGPWSPVMTITVRDEPAVFDGWTFSAKRLRGNRLCPSVLRLRGVIAWQDNDRATKIRAWISLLKGSRSVSRAEQLVASDGRFNAILCTRRPIRFDRVVARIIDRAGHVTRGVDKRQ